MKTCKKYLILVKSIFRMFITCLQIIFAKLFFTKKRSTYLIHDIMLNSATKILSYIKANITINNPHKVAYKDGDQKYIIMCNHTSLYDIPISIYALPDFNFRFVAKKELTRVPIFGWAIKMSGSPIINRKNREESHKNMNNSSDLINAGVPIWIAPEGHRSTTGDFLPLKKGGFVLAIQTQAEIIPILLKGADNILPAKTTMLNCNQNINVYIGKPISTKEYTLEQKEELIQEVEKFWQTADSTETYCNKTRN